MHTETAEENSNTTTEIAEGVHGEEFLINGGNLQSGQARESRVPPFLQKISQILDDPETKSTVSWNSNGTSFIIWDHNKFSEKILPKYFKTNVFSSFVSQLNAYGFRKISCDRHEYANPWFQAGKKEWLKNIKRRNEKPQITKKRGCLTLNHNSTNAAVEQELQVLMTEQNNMKGKIQKLKGSLGNMERQITSIKINMRSPEFNDNEVNVPEFLKQMQSENNGKKPRLTELTITESKGIEIYIPKVSLADSSGNSTQATKENAESLEFLKKILADDTWSSIEGTRDLQVHHSKAIVELDKMMESYRAMEGENLKAKASDQEVDKMMESYRDMEGENLKAKASDQEVGDDVPIDLWA